MTHEELAIKQHLSKPRPVSGPCSHMGPRGDDPACPCDMMWYENVNDDLYQIEEHRSISGVTLSATKIK